MMVLYHAQKPLPSRMGGSTQLEHGMICTYTDLMDVVVESLSKCQSLSKMMLCGGVHFVCIALIQTHIFSCNFCFILDTSIHEWCLSILLFYESTYSPLEGAMYQFKMHVPMS
jgi:hypothetical protein